NLWVGPALGPSGRNLPAGWADSLYPIRRFQSAGGSCLARHEREPEWQRTLKAGDVGHDHLPVNGLQLDVARAMKGKDELIWETRAIPQHAHDHKEFCIAWEGG